MKSKKPKPKTKTKTNRVDHHALLDDQYGRSRCPSGRVLMMLAQVNFLILPPLITLNHKLNFFSTYLLILLFKLWKCKWKFDIFLYCFLFLVSDHPTWMIVRKPLFECVTNVQFLIAPVFNVEISQRGSYAQLVF